MTKTTDSLGSANAPKKTVAPTKKTTAKPASTSTKASSTSATSASAKPVAPKKNVTKTTPPKKSSTAQSTPKTSAKKSQKKPDIAQPTAKAKPVAIKAETVATKTETVAIKAETVATKTETVAIKAENTPVKTPTKSVAKVAPKKELPVKSETKTTKPAPKTTAKPTSKATKQAPKVASKTTAKATTKPALKKPVPVKTIAKTTPKVAPKTSPESTTKTVEQATTQAQKIANRAETWVDTRGIAQAQSPIQATTTQATQASVSAPTSTPAQAQGSAKKEVKKTPEKASGSPQKAQGVDKKTPAGTSPTSSPAKTRQKPEGISSAKAGSQSDTKKQTTSQQKNKIIEQPSLAKNLRRKMLVSIVPEEQVEVVLAVEGHVHEYYVEMLHQAKTKGNIYKGTINNIDPNLQAAFVNYGAGKNGFLQIDEVHPEYFSSSETGKNHKYPAIQKVLKPGQEILVQVVKEPMGTKGAFLTTYLSLPGRFLVLTPGREQIGISRKVDNEEERSRLRELLNGLNPGPGLGVIVRTVSVGEKKTNLSNDLAYLKRIWNGIRTKGMSESAPSIIYQELDLAARAVRDYLTDDVTEVWIDDEKAGKEVAELVNNLFPRKKNFLRIHTENSSLFERFNLQRQLEQIHSREVALPSGGRLAIDPTEALTAIDINSGRSGGKSNFEDMAYRTNLEAAKMIPLQLRLRDIGGQIVVDFIEMRDKNHWREVEKALRNGMKNDRARYDVAKISSFGMMEIVRQRLGSSAISVSTEPCPFCRGTGMRRNMEWQCQQALREITRQIRDLKNNEKNGDKNNEKNGEEKFTLLYEAEADLALYLLNFKRQRLFELEHDYNASIEIKPK